MGVFWDFAGLGFRRRVSYFRVEWLQLLDCGVGGGTRLWSVYLFVHWLLLCLVKVLVVGMKICTVGLI